MQWRGWCRGGYEQAVARHETAREPARWVPARPVAPISCVEFLSRSEGHRLLAAKASVSSPYGDHQMKIRQLVSLLGLALLVSVPCWGAEQVTEAWRSVPPEFHNPQSVSVNSADGSCWVADYGQWSGGSDVGCGVVHLSAGGAVLWRGAAFSEPSSVSVNSTDGSCWVADTGHNQVVHLSSAGAELWRSDSGAFSQPSSVSVNPTDGSCWVADRVIARWRTSRRPEWNCGGAAHSSPRGRSR